MNVSLKQFLQHGSFGSLYPGCSESEIITNLGPPEKFHSALEDTASRAMYVYGSVEFWTVPTASTAHMNIVLPKQVHAQQDGRICEGVFLEASGPQEQGPFLFPERCSMIDWDIQSGMTPEFVIQYLFNNGFSFREAYAHSDPFTLIVDGSDASLTFDENRLHGIFVGFKLKPLS